MAQKVKIEDNPLKIMLKTIKKIFKSGIFYFWLILMIAMFVTYFLLDDFISLKLSFSLYDFLSPSITGLSFTLALLGATARIFSVDELKKMYEFESNNYKKGELFYCTIAPYIFTSAVWLMISLVAILSKVVAIEMPRDLRDIFKIIFISMVILGVLNLWALLVHHIQDTILAVGRKINDSE